MLQGQLWVDWLAFIGSTPEGGSVAQFQIPIPLWIRLPAAVVLVAWGALTDRRWTVPVAATLALPVLWVSGFAICAALASDVDVANGRTRTVTPVESTEDVPGRPTDGPGDGWYPRSPADGGATGTIASTSRAGHGRSSRESAAHPAVRSSSEAVPCDARRSVIALQSLAAELAITLADGAVWLSIGQGLLFGAVCLLFGIWVARRVGLLASDAPAGETLGVGLASG